MNTYLTTRGTPFTDIDGYQTIDFIREFDGRDARMAQTVISPTYKMKISGRERLYSPNWKVTRTGYHPIKWSIDDDADNVLSKAASWNSLPILRYAEVLLNYAEAVFERDGQISDEDLAISLNLTRKRINPEMPDLTNDFVTANNLDMRTEIRRERTIEFFDENFRIDDLKRWKTAEDEMPMNLTGVKWKDTDFESRWPDASFKDKDGEGCIIHEKGRNWHEKHYLLPLPTDQLKLNSNLKQNPGWNQ